MNIAIIGGGITGLTAAYELTKQGHEVMLFEKESYLGGLAQGFKAPGWKWHLEAAYHHLFTNDAAILGLLKELGLEKECIVKRPITSTLWKQHMYPLDSAISLLQFPGLPVVDRIRTGMVIAGMKLFPWWQVLEQFTVNNLFRPLSGESGWKVIWEPLMVGKFGKYAPDIAASWLWARIKKRTPSLVYIEGGFQSLVHTLEMNIKKHGGKIQVNTSVTSITQKYSSSKKKDRNNETFKISYSGNKTYIADKVIVTIPTPLVAKIIPDLSKQYLKEPLTIPHLHAQVLILETEKPILDTVYWLNITDRSFPFLAVVAHTNYMDKKHYGGHHITYIGNYLPPDHPYLTLTKEQLWKTFLPYLQTINPNISAKYIHSYMFTAPFAQPVHEKNYSKKAPPIKTPIEGLYLANMDSIFPWDRGTNYAVELGQKVANLV